MTGFIKLQRSYETAELVKDPKALALFTLVAIRARWHDSPNRHNLKIGQALIGDPTECGLSPKEYRTAKKRLEKTEQVAFKGTSNGTIATIINTDVFEVSSALKGEQRGELRTGKGQPKDDQGATNEEGNNGENGEIETISYSQAFLDWWDIYPRKVGKLKTFSTYQEAIKLVADEKLRAGVCLMIEDMKMMDQENEYYPNPETWLRDHRWEDEYPLLLSHYETK